MERPPTPQILHDPIVEPDDEPSFDWYYGLEAGGYVLTFGKFDGRKIHAASLSYLYWADRTFDYNQRNRRFLDAFRDFHDGLEEYAKTNYGDFIVPFGRKHWEKTISQCRDKPWLKWVMKQLSKKRVMERKYGVFFEAVDIWLQKPRHQEVKRNIGELLDASEYEDDLNLIHEFDEDYEDDATESDLEFIVSDSEEVLVEGSESASESSAKATDTSDNDSEGNDQSESSAESTPEPEQRTHRSNRGASRHKKDDFIENDEESDGSEEYEEAEACEPEERPQTPPRTLRSSMRKKGLAKQARSNEYEVPDSEQRIQTSPRVLRSAKVVSKQDTVATPTRKLRSASKTAVAKSSAAKEKESEPRRNVVAISPSPILHRGHDNDGSSSDASDDKPLTQFQTPQKRSRRNVIRTPSDSEDKNEGSEGIAVPPTPSVAGSSPIRSRKYGKQYSKPPSSKFTRSQANQKARGVTDAAFQARMINDYFVNAQQPALPPDIRHALNAVASYVRGQQDCTDRNAPSDCDMEMDNA